MSPEPSMLELLRSRLTDLEARQRAAGGVAEHGFWDGFAGRMPSAPSQPRAGSAPGSSGPEGSHQSVVSLEPLALDNVQWLDEAGYEEMINDPAWIESVCARHEAREQREAAAGGCQDAVDAITVKAMAGIGLSTHGGADLTAAAEQVAQQRRTLEVTLVTIVSELVSRGIEAPDGLSRTDWLRSHDPSLTAGQAKAFVTVGTALAEARWARLRLLVATQQVTVGSAAQIVEFDARTRPVADADDLETALGDLTDQARQLRPEELARLARHHTEQIRPPRDEDRLDRGRREARGLWFTQPNATGMVGLRGVLDPEGAAVLKAAIDPLSAPAPEKDDQGRTVTPDDRTPARRRMDALLTIVQRGVASADGIPSTDKTKVVVLIDYDTLVDDVRGSGTTLTGDVLSPGVVRRMACDAEVIPIVLGSDSEPLDVGRSRRLFTRSQRLALIARDQGCSFPGCTVPATWCDAHHVTHWRHGGRTCVSNGALLCQRHHTEVHDRDLTATVTATGVTWHT
ncbi:HNH endonuclease signature motif containing protein [Terrabacter terrae]